MGVRFRKTLHGLFMPQGRKNSRQMALFLLFFGLGMGENLHILFEKHYTLKINTMKLNTLHTLLLGATLLALPLGANAKKNNGDCCGKCNGKGVVEVKCSKCDGTGHIKGKAKAQVKEKVKEIEMTDDMIRLAISGQTFTGNHTEFRHDQNGFNDPTPVTRKISTKVTLQFQSTDNGTVLVTLESSPSDGRSSSRLFPYVVKDGEVVIEDNIVYKVKEQGKTLVKIGGASPVFPQRFSKMQ